MDAQSVEMILETGRKVVARQAAVVAALEDRIGDDFVAATQLLLDCRGRVVCCGVGKSGIIARKFAATLASLGTVSVFLHAAEAVHGDLGMVSPDDVVVLFSHSGTTAEVLAMLPPLEALGVRTIAITDHPGSPLCAAVDVTVCPACAEEADHLGLAPTASTTAALVLCDAMAVAIAVVRGFTREDFARRHPGGALGQQLALSDG